MPGQRAILRFGTGPVTLIHGEPGLDRGDRTVDAGQVAARGEALLDAALDRGPQAHLPHAIIDRGPLHQPLRQDGIPGGHGAQRDIGAIAHDAGPRCLDPRIARIDAARRRAEIEEPLP